MKMKKTFNWFKEKKVTASFAGIALASGFFFMNKGITGNVVLTAKQPFNLVSLIGLLLIFCSFILAGYSIRKRK